MALDAIALDAIALEVMALALGPYGTGLPGALALDGSLSRIAG
jgi:hypothetical protein